MIRLDRICVYIIMLGLIFIIPSVMYITFLDELFALVFGILAGIDCLVNNHWKRYKLLWIIIGIMTFYAIYSLTYVHFQTPAGIALDWVIELKTFIPFIVLFAVVPQFTEQDKRIISTICIFNAVVMACCFLMGPKVVSMIVFHVAYGGSIIFLSCIYLIYCNFNKLGQLSRNTLIAVVVLLTFGLLCTRSKYYGIYTISIALLFFYRPNFFRNFNWRHALYVFGLILIVLAVSWKKIEYYFLTGASESFDPKVIESFARPVLYLTGGLIFLDFFPFGSGLGSFGSFASEKYYSDIYYYYGIDKVWGLSPSTGFFICDAYYPMLAQFGIFGVGLFIWFWVYIYKFLRVLIRKNPSLYRYPFTVGALIVCFILIECTSGTSFTQQLGVFAMTLLGIICGTGREIKKADREESNLTNKKTIKI